jgi:hypothetical protein
MQASNKYEVSAPVDVASQVAFDVSTALNRFQQAATVDPALGMIESVNLGSARDTIASYQDQLRAHLEATQPGFTSVEMLGWPSRSSRVPSIPAPAAFPPT